MPVLCVIWALLCLGCRSRDTRQPIAEPSAPAADPRIRPTPQKTSAARAGRLPDHQRFSSLAAALQDLLAQRPLVLGIGEYHQKKGGAQVMSAVARFAEDALDPLAKNEASDLVVETWVTGGRCGKQEKRVVAKVEKATARPQTTENELIRLLRRAKALGVRPHILTLTCEDYGKLAPRGGKLDYEVLLGTVTRYLLKKTRAVLRHRLRVRKVRKAKRGTLPLVIVYGGALHNDLRPPEGLEAFSYATTLDKELKGRFLELDLYVPEYIRGDAELEKQPWYPLLATVKKGEVVLYRRRPRSYLLLLSPGRVAAKKDRLPGS